MWRRKAFKQFRDWSSHKREKGRVWADRHAGGVICFMFCVMVSGVLWLLITSNMRDRSTLDSLRTLSSGLQKGLQGTPVTTDVLEALRLYSRVQHINPDSLTARDSTFLKEIDQQLNSIIHE